LVVAQRSSSSPITAFDEEQSKRKEPVVVGQDLSEANIDDVLANAAASLVSNFLSENLLGSSKSRYNSGASVNQPRQEEIQDDNLDEIEDEPCLREKSVDSLLLDKDLDCRECQAPSPSSVSIITLSSDSEHDNAACIDEEDEEDFERRFVNDEEDYFKEAVNGVDEEEVGGGDSEELQEHGYTPTAFNSGDSIVEATGGIKKERLSIENYQQMGNCSRNDQPIKDLLSFFLMIIMIKGLL